MRHAPVWQLMMNMCLPAVFVTLVMVAYNMADVYFVGRTGSAVQVAAISIAGPIYGIIQGIGTLIGQGACTAAALESGRGCIQGARAMGSFCMWSALVLGLGFAAVGICFAGDISAWLGADAETAVYVEQYLHVLVLGAPAILVSGVLANVARADGSVRASMLGSMLGTLLNIALDPLFIEVLGMGVEGAALATVIGGAVSCAYMIAHAAHRDDLSLSLHALRGQGALCVKALALGAPMAVSTMLGSISGAMGNALFAAHGQTAVAAMGISSKAGMLIGMVALGICMGIQPAISYNFGRGDMRRTLEIVRGMALLVTIPCALLALGMFVWRADFVAAFINDAQVLELGAHMMAVSLLVCPLVGIYQLCTTLMQATSHAAHAIALSAFRQGAIYIPCLYVGDMLAGLDGLIWAAPVADIAGLAAALTMTMLLKKKLNEHMPEYGA